MWKYLSGVEQPPKKSKKDYEENRKPRSFREIWRENRAWLQYDEKEGAMFCTSCKTTSKQNKFVKGCRSFRLESVKIHENSEFHKHDGTDDSECDESEEAVNMEIEKELESE